jgi:hypothetical protein
MSVRKNLLRFAPALVGAPVLLGALPASVCAQTNLYGKTGDTNYDRLGTSVRLAGDVNHDTKQDFIVGAPQDGNLFSPGNGLARVYSGTNGNTLFTFHGLAVGDAFGQSVDGVGDVNNDGFADVIVGAPLANNRAGAAYVFSGQTGTVLFTVNGDSANDELGYTVAGVGDVNNDGRPDFLAASPFAAGGGTSRGIARIDSGLNGSVLTTINGTSNNNRFGASADGVGDVNNDGRADVIGG